MGQTLSEPITEKHTASGEDERLAWAVSEMQGWRLSMEDAHAHILSLEGSGKTTSFFSVYDGHGGSTVARFAGDTLHERLAHTDAFREGKYEASLKRAFLGTDEDLRANPDFTSDPSGCTAVAVLVTEDYHLICANAGDSRSVMSVGGEAKPLSFDHKPTHAKESSRIVAAGGFVEFGRVNGNLALSRALGDFEFKQNPKMSAEEQVVTADPDITVHDPTDKDEFIVVACDGIWDVMSSREVIDWVRRGIADGKPLDQLCEELMSRCLAPDSEWGGVGCDNMTAMIVAIKRGKTTEEWYEWMKKNVDDESEYATPKTFTHPFANAQNRGGPTGGPSFSISGIGGQAAGGGGGGLSVLRGGQEDGEDDDEELDLPALQAALRAQGFRIAVGDEEDEDDDAEFDDDDAEGDEAGAKISEVVDDDGDAPVKAA